MRSSEESNARPDPHIDGIEVVLLDTDAQYYKKASSETLKDLASMYLFMIDTNIEWFHTLFAHVRDRPDQPFLIHCTGTHEALMDTVQFH